MKIQVTYATTYAYQSEARAILQLLRLTPRSHEGQHVVSWQVEADADVQLRASTDPFGNWVHTLSTDRPLAGLTITVRGEVRTAETGGVVARAAEPLPAAVYLRDTALTRADPALDALAQALAAEAGPDPLMRLHALLRSLNAEVTFDSRATEVTGTAAEAYRLRRGVCQDLSHIFLAVARRLQIPARYISGHMVRQDGVVDQEAGHAWVEALVSEVGWVGFDPTNGICPTEGYIRVAMGLDYLDAAPIRGARNGGGEETMSVRLRVAEAQQQ